MKSFYQLNEEQQRQAVERVRQDLVNRKVAKQLVGTLEEILAEAEVEAVPVAKNAWYSAPGDLIISGVAK